MYTAKVNHKFLFPFACLVGMSTIQYGFALAGYNAVGPYLAEVNGWKESETTTVVAAMTAVGLGIGSFLGGFVVQKGRREMILIMNILGAFGTGITLIEEFYAIVAGKTIFAIATGVLLVAAPLILEETIPVQAAGIYGSFTNIFVVLGLSTMMFLAGIIPTETEANYYTSNAWRLIHGLNFIPQAISMIGFGFFVKTDSIKFHIDKKENDKVLQCIKKIYLEDADKILEEVLEEVEEFGDNAEQVSLGHCLTMPGYW